MRLLVFGQTGQVALELARAAPDARCLGRDEADLADPVACAARIDTYRPDAVINAAAYTAVDAAETDEAQAMRVNAEAPAAMARAAAALAIPLVHVSTDYVFDGAGTQPFAPDHPPAPLNAYGRTKLAGEEGVRAAGGPHAVLRTSWVFSAHGANFVTTMLRVAQTRDTLDVVADQIGGPTPAADIATACLTIARTLRSAPERTGTYHYAGAPDTSWKGFAEAIFARAGRAGRAGRAVTVRAIPTADWPTPAARPLNSRLDCTATRAAFGLARPDWRAGLTRVLEELS